MHDRNRCSSTLKLRRHVVRIQVSHVYMLIVFVAFPEYLVSGGTTW